MLMWRSDVLCVWPESKQLLTFRIGIKVVYCFVECVLVKNVYICRCPLFTENLNRFHADAVLKGAAQAKDELGVNVNPAVLKNDPAKDIQQHYN